MRICPKCSSRMELKLSNNIEKIDNRGYYKAIVWFCSENPTCNLPKETFLYRDVSENWLLDFSDRRNYPFNSLKIKNPNDFIYDGERYFAIHRNYDYQHSFSKEEIEKLEIKLGFESMDDFIFWVCTQKLVVDHGVHGNMPVGSPYYFTFQNLINGLNSINKNVLISTSNNNGSIIQQSILPWTELFHKRRMEGIERQLESERKDPEIVERKAEKATVNLLYAIRRNDIKAIKPLLNKGARTTDINEDGLNSIDYAKSLNRDEIVEIIINHKKPD